jgi:sialate O-acetylesterase
MNARLMTLLALVALPLAARADVKPHELFTDNMVLQANRENAVWGTADPGEEVMISIVAGKNGVANTTRADEHGRWQGKLPSLPATSDETAALTLTLKGKGNTVTLKNVLVGEVWVCSGQSNMQWEVRQSFDAQKAIAASKDPLLRLYSVPRTTSLTPLTAVPHLKDSKGQFTNWYEANPDTVPSFSAVAYFFGKHLREKLKVPVGLIHTSWGGTPAEAWTSRQTLDSEPALRYYHEKLATDLKNYEPDRAKEQYQTALKKWEKDAAEAKAAGKPAPRKPQPMQSPEQNPHSASVLYNAMIAPLIPYGIAGAIWYQGESNAGKAYEYRTLFADMIKDWRQHWGQGDFPFLFVQLAPFEAGNQPTWPELREAQFLTLALPRTGMAVITDVGEPKDIHPKKKDPVGERLALAALAIAYGQPVEYTGPVYESMTTQGNRVVLKFAHASGGLEAKGGKLTGFTVAGDDQKFVEAQAEITGPDTVTVSASGVDRPAAVRFGWSNYPHVNLWNKAGLPATPFRTDTWPLITQPKSAK